MRKSFILHIDSLVILDEMTDEQAGKFLKSIYHYQRTNKLPELNFAMKMAITPFINQFTRDDERYESIVERNKINGSKGGRPKNPENPVGYLGTQKTQANPNKPKKADSDSKSDSDNKNDNKKEKENTKEELLVIPKKNYAVEMINIWNEVCRSLPKATLYVEDRNKKLNNLIGNKKFKDNEGKPLFEDIEDWKCFCEMIQASTISEWKACAIDWVLKPANMIKIYEGNYGNKK